MPELIRIYSPEKHDSDEAATHNELGVTTQREHRLFVALSILTSVNVLFVCSIATFTALVLRH